MPLYRCYFLDRDDHIRERIETKPLRSVRLLTGRSNWQERVPKIVPSKSGRALGESTQNRQ
jgi:hypothetical protein